MLRIMRLRSGVLIVAIAVCAAVFAASAFGAVRVDLVGSYDTPDLATCVALSGTTAYVADGSDGLQIIDVSTPTAPVLLGSYDTSGTARGVAFSGTIA